MRRRRFTLTLLHLAILLPVASSAQLPDDFDFLLGRWEMTVTRHSGAEPRVLGTEISVVERALGGTALVDTWNENGFTIRTFDPNRNLWRLFWTDRGTFQGRIQFWEGRFEGGVGIFIGGDSFPDPQGRITSKIVFSDIRKNSVHWEMYHTRDNGETWSLTDVREYRRIER